MDWVKQSEEIMKNWTTAQKETWEKWLEMTQSAGATPPLSVWQKTIEAWQSNVQKTMAAQAEWTEAWFNSLDAQRVPEPVTQWAQQGRTAMKQWQGTQEKLWQNWFDLMRKTEPVKLGETWQAEGQKAFATWQAAAQKVTDAQMELLKTWMPANGAKTRKAA